MIASVDKEQENVSAKESHMICFCTVDNAWVTLSEYLSPVLQTYLSPIPGKMVLLLYCSLGIDSSMSFVGRWVPCRSPTVFVDVSREGGGGRRGPFDRREFRGYGGKEWC